MRRCREVPAVLPSVMVFISSVVALGLVCPALAAGFHGLDSLPGDSDVGLFEAEGEVTWIEGTTPPAAWILSPPSPTVDGLVGFSGPTTAVYGNACTGRQAGGGTPTLVVDSVNHRVELWFEPPAPVMCPLVWQPVCGLEGQFGPLEEGDWLFVADTSIFSFSIPFHIFPAGYEDEPYIIEGTPVAGMMGLGLIAAACALGGISVLHKKG